MFILNDGLCIFPEKLEVRSVLFEVISNKGEAKGLLDIVGFDFP